MKRPALRDRVFLHGQLVGLAIPFLPITNTFVPIIGLAESPYGGFHWPAFLLLVFAPLLLVPAMAASTVRQALRGRLSGPERVGAYAVAFAVLMANALVAVRYGLGPVIGPTFLIVSVGAAVVLASTRKGRLPPHVHAHLALLTAWVVDLGFSVVATLESPAAIGPGCLAAAASLLAVAVEAVVRVRRALLSEGDPQKGAR
ncbi:MAG: hypothetical protein ACYTKD_29080 [Planctomycetota bacterium]|jgi:hypothetical protein